MNFGNSYPGSGGPCGPATAFQTDVLILDGAPLCWTPSFTWHGFRFIEISEVPLNVTIESIVCYPMRSDVAVTGKFDSSNALLNRIHVLDRQTAEANMMSVQSDCPHRERLGYGGDAMMSAESLIMNFDMTLFYQKRTEDYLDAQRANGGFTETAPYVGIDDAGMGEDSGTRVSPLYSTRPHKLLPAHPRSNWVANGGPCAD